MVGTETDVYDLREFLKALRGSLSRTFLKVNLFCIKNDTCIHLSSMFLSCCQNNLCSQTAFSSRTQHLCSCVQTGAAYYKREFFICYKTNVRFIRKEKRKLNMSPASGSAAGQLSAFSPSCYQTGAGAVTTYRLLLKL